MEETKPYRFVSEFAAMVEARRLASFRDDDNLLAVYASSKILPYQIAAARFALRSRLIKGCILCDEGSLGKTYEALLVVAQRWYEGKEHILVVLPQNLMTQWQQKLDEEFTLPVIKWAEYTADSKGICLVTYDDVIREAEKVKSIRWDLAVFDEADFLFKPDNKSVATIKGAVGDAFKLLLTPTPITMSIMDIYGLIHFIDESVLPDPDSFYRRYFRKPENYPELSSWVSQFAFRTLKSQASQYVNFTRRLPIVLNYSPKDDEKRIYNLTEKYLNLAEKQAYPQMDNYQLSLMFYHILASSPQAFASMLKAPIERTLGDERVILESMRDMADKIPEAVKEMGFFKLALVTYVDIYCQEVVTPEFPEGAKDVGTIAISKYYDMDYEKIVDLPESISNEDVQWVNATRRMVSVFGINNETLLWLIEQFMTQLTGKEVHYGLAEEFKPKAF